ncbi:MAG: phenylalanine--tRNA ligase subunit beta [Actinomycetota bacterium]
MRVPLSWLREFTPVDDDPDAFATRLSMFGLKVDQVIRVGEGIRGIVVGEVRAVREHPDADSLMLVRAFDGSTERDIVCGARNYTVGDRVPLALPGATLPNGMEIDRRVVRGETSDGMLCSARELQLADDHSGIMVLDADAPVGKDLVSALDLADVIFDFDVTGNRPDALSILGIARDVSILYRLPLTIPSAPLVESGPDVTSLASVTIEDARGCPRYVARVIEGVRIGPSPWWMRRRLMAAGMRPISNVVDVTNYVLLERGHPLHAFDLDELAGSSIVVRRAHKGDQLTTLDGQERALRKEDVLICDADHPVALAGVMGGAKTEVSGSTTRILLESAYFAPARVAHTSRRLGMRTEASIRFEHGADVDNAPIAAERAAGLLASLAGGTVARGVIDVYPKPIVRKPIRVRVARVNALLGTEEPAAEMAGLLGALGCRVEASRSVLRVAPPSWRPDIEIEENVVEEIARLHGYDRIPETLPRGGRIGGLTLVQRLRRVARAALSGAGVTEAQTLSLLPPWFSERAALPADHELRARVRLANPLSEDESLLRPSLIPGLLLAAQHNVARRTLPVRLFELGTVFAPHADGVAETERLAFVLTGPTTPTWHAQERELDYFDGKGVLEVLAAALGVPGFTVRPDDWEGVGHPGRSARVVFGDLDAGRLIELHPKAAQSLELPRRVVVCELDLGSLFSAASPQGAAEPARFPALSRDLALVVPGEVPADEVARAIRLAAGPLLAELRLFDVYRGDQIPEGTVSLAFSLALRDPERTLTDADADGVMAAIAARAAAGGWQIRD